MKILHILNANYSVSTVSREIRTRFGFAAGGQRQTSCWPSLARLLRPSWNSCWHSRCGKGQWVTSLRILRWPITTGWWGGEERLKAGKIKWRGGERCDGGGADRGGVQAWFRPAIFTHVCKKRHKCTHTAPVTAVTQTNQPYPGMCICSVGLKPRNAPLPQHQHANMNVCVFPSHPETVSCLETQGSQRHAEGCWCHALMCARVGWGDSWDSGCDPKKTGIRSILWWRALTHIHTPLISPKYKHRFHSSTHVQTGWSSTNMYMINSNNKVNKSTLILVNM